MKNYLSFLVIVFVILSSCSEENITETVGGNNPPDPKSVPSIKVESYVGRLFIDLLGRTPTEIERKDFSKFLIDNNLSFESREELILQLQSDKDLNKQEISYKSEYYQRLYNLAKFRLVEGAEDVEFTQRIGLANNTLKRARLEGDSVAVFGAMHQIERNQKVLNSKIELENGTISLEELYARMLNNFAYDVINMNTFNFINASFDDLFFRFPTSAEYDAAFPIIENNLSGVLFGKFIENKYEYCGALTQSNDFYEGMVKWTFLSLLGRQPNAQELYHYLIKYKSDQNFSKFQLLILKSNEYAQF